VAYGVQSMGSVLSVSPRCPFLSRVIGVHLVNVYYWPMRPTSAAVFALPRHHVCWRDRASATTSMVATIELSVMALIAFLC